MYKRVYTCLNDVHTCLYLNIYERVHTVYIPCTYMFINIPKCMYVFIHFEKCINMSVRRI